MFVDDDARRDAEACLRGELDIRQDTDPDHNKIRRDMAAVAQADAGNLPIRALDAGRLHPKMNADAGRGMSCLKIIRDFGSNRARHHPRTEFDHIDLKPLGTCSRGKFETDEARADHRNMSRDADPLAQPLAFIEDAQVFDVGEVSVGQIEKTVTRAGREHQMPVIKKAP